MSFPQKLRRKQDIIGMIFFLHLFCIAYRNRGFDDHHCLRIHGKNRLDDIFHAGSIKIVFLRIIIGRRRDDDKIRTLKCQFFISRRREIQVLCGQIFRDLLIHDRGNLLIDHLRFFFNDIQCHHFVILCQ